MLILFAGVATVLSELLTLRVWRLGQTEHLDLSELVAVVASSLWQLMFCGLMLSTTLPQFGLKDSKAVMSSEPNFAVPAILLNIVVSWTLYLVIAFVHSLFSQRECSEVRSLLMRKVRLVIGSPAWRVLFIIMCSGFFWLRDRLF